MTRRIPIQAQKKAAARRDTSATAIASTPRWPWPGKTEITLTLDTWPKMYAKLHTKIEAEQDAENNALNLTIRDLLDTKDALSADLSKACECITAFKSAAALYPHK